MRFRYLGDDARTFPHVSLEVEPGDTVELDENPDPRWFEPDAFGHVPEEPTPEDS